MAIELEVPEVVLGESDFDSDFQIFAELEDMHRLQFHLGFPLRTVQACFAEEELSVKASRRMKSQEKQYRLPETENLVPRKVKLILQRQR